MRIIAGKYGRRKLETPKNNHIRPTSDKIRGSIFNALQSHIDLNGVRVLDLFSGTGALGLEALSRGAKFCQFFDNDRESFLLTRFNADTLATSWDFKTTMVDATKLPECKDEKKFDLFFCDPPYEKDLISPCLKTLHDQNWLNDGAIGVLETEKDAKIEYGANFEVLSEKNYGDTDIIFITYKKA